MVRKLIWILAALCVLTCCILYSSIFRLSKNFHEVDPGQFYRSAQLLPSELEDAVNKYHIRTLINLRGEQPDVWWYQQEKKTAGRLGLKYMSFGFSSNEVPIKSAAIEYLQAIRTAPRPILVHCRSGADRTSEASAMYLMEIKGVPREEAIKQLSIKYEHVDLFVPAKKFFIQRFQGLAWLQNSYDPCSAEYKPYFDQKSYCPR